MVKHPASSSSARQSAFEVAAFRHREGLGTGILRISGLVSHGSLARLLTHPLSRYQGKGKARLPACRLDFDRAGIAPAGGHL